MSSERCRAAIDRLRQNRFIPAAVQMLILMSRSRFFISGWRSSHLSKM